jgi:DNA repair photolyase
MEEYVSVCKKMIDAGHEIMYTTKPHMEGMLKFCKILDQPENEKYKPKIHIYACITTKDHELTSFFEPNAAFYEERLECLKMLFERGFRTSVMMEPYLSNPLNFVYELLPYVNEVLTIGKMNYAQAIRFSDDNEYDYEWVTYLNKLYSVENIVNLYEALKNEPKVFFKKCNIKILLKYAK